MRALLIALMLSWASPANAAEVYVTTRIFSPGIHINIDGRILLVHAHMLRHGCGYALANAGHDTRAIQDRLGHRSIQHTVRYTELAPTRFKDFWRQ
jgi:site-specific recombinase XerD